MKSLRIMAIIGIVLAGLCIIGMPDENSDPAESAGVAGFASMYLMALAIVSLIQTNKALKQNKMPGF